MLSISVDRAHFIGLLIGLFIYGCYFSIFILTIHILFGKSDLSRVVLLALFALFVLSTGYYVLAAYDIYLAFIPMRSIPGTDVHLMDYSDPIPPIKDIMYMLSLGVADSLLVWRLYVIWPENKIVFAMVAVLFCEMFTVAFGVGINEVKQLQAGNETYVRVLQLWTVGGSAIILTTNLLVTTMITWRLRWMGNRIALFGEQSRKLYHSIIFVMVQNGSLYFICVVMQLIVYAAGVEGAVYLFLHISPAVVALFPTAIVLQLNLPQRNKPVNSGSTAVDNWRARHASTAIEFRQVTQTDVMSPV